MILGTFTKSSTGETFRDFGFFRLTFNPMSGALETVSGLTARYQIRGPGLEYVEAGRKIFDASGNLVFAAGPKDSRRSAGRESPRCSADVIERFLFRAGDVPRRRRCFFAIEGTSYAGTTTPWADSCG
jgi:hypothetical protein